MKKNVFALGVAAALAGFAGTVAAQEVPFLPNTTAANPATEFAINDGGVGHILLTPYYSVQGQRNTLLNLVNTDTVNGKAVKVRFRGARNSDDVFDFYVFLSPGDNWRARVYPEGEKVFVDVSVDTSCTLPARNQFPQNPFSTERVFGNNPAEVREGYVEILTAADIPPATSGLYPTIKHNADTGAVTCSNSVIQSALAPLQAGATVPVNGLSFPTTGLIGHWAITQVETNSTVSGNMTAVEARNAAGLAAAGNLVVSPQRSVQAPLSWTAANGLGTADPLFIETNGRIVPAQYFDFPDLSTPYLGAGVTADDQANQLAQNIAVSEVINEFTTRAANFRTDWVFSMPTRRYGVAINYGATAAGSSIIYNAASQFFDVGNTRLITENGVPAVRIDVVSEFYDMNERSGGAEFSPRGVPGINGEVSVLSFNANGNGSVLGAQLTTYDLAPSVNGESIDSGWGSISLANVSANAAVNGLPVIGYAALTAGGQNLGFTWPHRYKHAQ